MIRILIFVLLFSVNIFAWNYYPLQHGPHKYDYKIIGDLYSAVVERCEAVGISPPAYTQNFTVATGSSSLVYEVEYGSNTYSRTNVYITYEQVETVNVYGPFMHNGNDCNGYLTKGFINHLQSKIKEAMPRYVQFWKFSANEAAFLESVIIANEWNIIFRYPKVNMAAVQNYYGLNLDPNYFNYSHFTNGVSWINGYLNYQNQSFPFLFKTNIQTDYVLAEYCQYIENSNIISSDVTINQMPYDSEFLGFSLFRPYQSNYYKTVVYQPFNQYEFNLNVVGLNINWQYINNSYSIDQTEKTILNDEFRSIESLTPVGLPDTNHCFLVQCDTDFDLYGLHPYYMSDDLYNSMCGALDLMQWSVNDISIITITNEAVVGYGQSTNLCQSIPSSYISDGTYHYNSIVKGSLRECKAGANRFYISFTNNTDRSCSLSVFYYITDLLEGEYEEDYYGNRTYYDHSTHIEGVHVKNVNVDSYGIVTFDLDIGNNRASYYYNKISETDYGTSVRGHWKLILGWSLPIVKWNFVY